MEKQKDIAFADVAREVDKGIAGADAQRADQLEHLAVARQAKGKGLERERARLAKKLGADHPRVAAIADRLTANAGMRRDLSLEVARARTPIPTVDDTTWAFLGVVRDPDLQPVAGITVALYDARGRWVESLGYACTDDNGRFRIEAKNVAAFKEPVFARASSADGTLLAVDENSLTPAGGAIDYREITLSGTATPCQSPGGGGQPGGPVVAVPDAWVVRGRVTGADGKGVGGVTVSVFDRDMAFADRLGRTETDTSGNYSFTYPADKYRDLIDRRPDIFVKVTDSSGETLFASTRPVYYEAGRVETVDAQIERRNQ